VPISVVCPCGAKVRAADSFARRTICCPKCGAALPVPDGPVVAVEAGDAASLPAIGVRLGDPPGIDGRPARKPDPTRPVRRKVKRGVAPAAVATMACAGLAGVALWLGTRSRPESPTPIVGQERTEVVAVEPLPGTKGINPRHSRPRQPELASTAERIAAFDSDGTRDHLYTGTIRAQAILNQAATIFRQSDDDLADIAMALSSDLRERGIIAPAHEILGEVTSGVPRPDSGRPTRNFRTWAGVYAEIRGKFGTRDAASARFRVVAQTQADR
jgi:hypothetical protein